MTSDDRRSPSDFLKRWSRLKQQADKAPAPTPAKSSASDAGPPSLPDPSSLTFDSDFAGFLHRKVDEKVRRLALKRLFHDPRFNVIDVMDDDLFDMSEWEPLPKQWLQDLRQFKHLLSEADEPEEKAKTPAATGPQPSGEAAAAPGGVSPDQLGGAELRGDEDVKTGQSPSIGDVSSKPSSG